MTYDELAKAILAILPDATIEELDGEIVVYTNLCEPVPGGNLLFFDELDWLKAEK